MSKQKNNLRLIDDYFIKTEELKAKYGEKSVVLMQVGSFFEVYGYKNNTTGDIYGSCVKEVSEICGIKISKKANVKMADENISCVMAGYPELALEKFTTQMNDSNFTVAVYAQEENKKNTTRKLLYISSPGTYFTDTITSVTNNISCIWIENVAPNRLYSNARIVFGMSTIDILSGQSSFNEVVNNYEHKPNDFDDLERYLCSYTPKELLFVFNSKNLSLDKLNDIIQYTVVGDSVIRRIDVNNSDCHLSLMAKKCDTQKYHFSTMEEYFDIPDITSFMEENGFYADYYAACSYSFLLNFVQSHNPGLVRNIPYPTKEFKQDFMTIGNHSLRQLNMIDTNINEGRCSSVVKILNKCYTKMGQRELKHQLLHPSLDYEWITRQYDVIETMQHFIDDTDDTVISQLRSSLLHCCDISRIYRKLVLGKLQYNDIVTIYETINYIDIILEIFRDTDDIMDYIGEELKTKNAYKLLKHHVNHLSELFDKYIDIDKCFGYNVDAIDACNFFKRGLFDTLDKAELQYTEGLDVIHTLMDEFNSIYDKHKETKRKTSTLPCKLHKPEKSVSYFCATKTSANIITEHINSECKLIYKRTYDGTFKEFCLTEPVKCVKATGSKLKLTNTKIDRLFLINLDKKLKLKQEVRNAFESFIVLLQDEGDIFTNISKFISCIDIVFTKARLSRKYCYCKPTINTEIQDTSYLIAKDMRHILIEQIQTQELYVPNDIAIGLSKDVELDEEYETFDSMLLFGTNAVGKSSFIKSVGICVMLAQAGMYVPCSKFEYLPFERIYTRIIGNDNIFKGLSTFAVEMVELKNILNYSNENTLVLGDELCSGTELGSAISIFVSGLHYLAKRSVKSIFATHFHEIVDMEMIQQIDTLAIKHMSVIYDTEEDCLIYNRKIQDGAGSNNYGLEVCKSLNLPQEFMDSAMDIRMGLNKKNKPVYMNDVSHFNAKKVKGDCEICGKEGIDVHHMQYQQNADRHGFIGKSFHKNHIANLMNICKDCHHTIHEKNIQYVRRKTTKGKKIIAL